MTKTIEITKVPAALAYGLDAHSARNCADRIKDVRQSERAKAKADTLTAANPLAAASEFFSKAVKAAPVKKAAPKSNRVVLKTNKEVRAQLTATAAKLGGKRLLPINCGLTSYTEFLNGFEDNNAIELQVVGADKVITFFAWNGKFHIATNKKTAQPVK
jgi:hypothetical protein